MDQKMWRRKLEHEWWKEEQQGIAEMIASGEMDVPDESAWEYKPQESTCSSPMLHEGEPESMERLAFHHKPGHLSWGEWYDTCYPQPEEMEQP